jgi:Uma2 family endonuclease
MKTFSAHRPTWSRRFDGVLSLHPRPASPHAQASTTLGEELGPPFKRGKGGPGGWVILFEPELHLGTEPDILVPDLAGWRRETMPEMPDAPFFTLRPDWVCEVLSPGTARHDRRGKMPVYQRERVGHVWLIEPIDRTLEVFELDGPTYRLKGTYADAERVQAVPFDAIELDLSVLWLRRPVEIIARSGDDPLAAASGLVPALLDALQCASAARSSGAGLASASSPDRAIISTGRLR